jgi:sterol desaturase/sphingolipid hydroxylase (fatty acid hydroxylase superfamily)
MIPILQAVLFWILTPVVVLLLFPLERFFPRLQDRIQIKGRIRAIAVMAILSLAATLLYQFYMQMPLIQWTVGLKLFDLASLPIPDWALIIVSVLILDALNYAIHALSHRVTLLWRVHSIHHSDAHVTALSGLLHHPLEVIVAGVWMLFFTVLFGIPVLVYVMYGLLASIQSALSHADVRVPRSLDRLLRLAVVTPDVHRIHHSMDMREGNSNFGTLLTIWDRIFGTYVDSPRGGSGALAMGLPGSERPRAFSSLELLLHPFRSRS